MLNRDGRAKKMLPATDGGPEAGSDDGESMMAWCYRVVAAATILL
jgi:hypothetical protein